MYKQIQIQSNDSWDNVSRRIFGTPERAGDFEKLNANQLNGNVIVFGPNETESETETENKGVYIEIDDKTFEIFPEYTLIDRLDGIKAGVFIFLLQDLNENPLRFNQNVNIYDENGLFFAGRIANIKPVRDERFTYIQLEVKSNQGILIESDCPYPLEFTNQSIKQILTTVAGYYGLEVEFDDSEISEEVFTNEIGTSFAAKINETAFQFMYRICSSRGLILKDTGTGLKVYKLNTDVEEKLNLIEGECIGIKSIRAEFLCDNLARYYEVNSQYPSSVSTVITTPYPIPITKRISSNDINANNIEETAERIVCRELGKHFKVFVELADNFSIKSGDLAIIKQTAIQIPQETEFVIEQVIRKKPDVLYLTLTLPCVYTGVLPDSLPLCGE